MLDEANCKCVLQKKMVTRKLAMQKNFMIAKLSTETDSNLTEYTTKFLIYTRFKL